MPSHKIIPRSVHNGGFRGESARFRLERKSGYSAIMSRTTEPWTVTAAAAICIRFGGHFEDPGEREPRCGLRGCEMLDLGKNCVFLGVFGVGGGKVMDIEMLTGALLQLVGRIERWVLWVIWRDWNNRLVIWIPEIWKNDKIQDWFYIRNRFWGGRPCTSQKNMKKLMFSSTIVFRKGCNRWDLINR